MKSLSNWNNVTDAERNELVFEHRNKAFGAYVLRKNHERTLFIAFFCGVGLLLLVLATPSIASWINGMNYFGAANDDKEVIVELMDAPSIDKNEVKPPVVTPPQEPISKTTQYTPPRVVPDTDVSESETMPVNETIVNPGLVTNDGDPNLVETPPIDDRAVIDDETDETKEWIIAEQMPSFPGGELELRKFLAQNIQYPTVAKETDIEGKVYVSFVVEREGSISNILIARDIGGGCGAEAVRVIKSMPKWIPGKQNGKTVRVKFMVPVHFMLQK